MAYCTTSDVRAICGLTTTDISDADLTTLITMATYQLNADINIKSNREKVEYIDSTRKNDLDSSTTKFYVKKWKDYCIGDLDNDGSVSLSDILAYLVDGSGTETTATVSSIDPDNGNFTLSSAPSADYHLYVTYVYSTRSEYEPDPLIKLACAKLASAYAMTRLDATKFSSYSIGKMRIARITDGFKRLYTEYKQIISQIKSFPIKKETSADVTSVVFP